MNLFDSVKTIIDLTHPITSAIPTWDGSCGFQLHNELDYNQCAPDSVCFRVQKLSMVAGIGTHIDAPVHCIRGGLSVAQIPLSRLIVPCVVIDVSAQSHERLMVSVDDVKEFEKKYGPIEEGSCVIVQTGWSRFWSDSMKYPNHYLFPSVSSSAAQLLVDRGIVGLGIDTLSPDRPDNNFYVHQTVLGAGGYIIENIAHADRLPPRGSIISVMPLKIEEGTESPVRLIGLLP